MKEKNKLSLFWGMIVAENFDYSKQKGLLNLIKLAMIVFSVLIVIKELVRLYGSM